MRDELNEPLGMGSDPLAQAASIGGWTFLMAAALVALAVGLGEEYLLLSLRPHNGAGLVAGSVAQATAPADFAPAAHRRGAGETAAACRHGRKGRCAELHRNRARAFRRA